MYLLFRLWNHLARRRQKQFIFLLLLMFVSALSEIVSLGALLPFLAVLTDPERVFAHPSLGSVVSFFHIGTAHDLLFPLTALFMIAAIAAGGLRLMLLWLNTRYSFAVGADLSIEVYRRTLYQPYSVHVARNSSEIISGISGKVGGVVYGGVLPVLALISSAVLIIAITSALMAIDASITIFALIGFGACYSFITWLFRLRLEVNSERIAHEQTQVIKTLQEGLGGIRDVLLDGTQPVYCDIYRKADHALRMAQGSNMFMTAAPRFAIEAAIMVLIAGLAYWLSKQPAGMMDALPVLGTLALGAQRLLPALQQGYGAWAGIIGSKASLADAISLLDQPLPPEAEHPDAPPWQFARDICFESVRYKYCDNGPWVLNDLSLTIRKGSSVGFVGSTGSGKSTTLDMLMGLLYPNEGSILIDGKPLIADHIRAWQQNIAHVPQYIFLADSTIAENIAFGVPKSEISLDRVKRAAQQAMIAEFVESRQEGYHAVVGERGIRLSGGQRQRIGIARALYKNAKVLVFDEATSALDNLTEQAVIHSLRNLSADLTVIIIAHRVTTVQHCDIIIELENGKVVAQGTYQELLKSSISFRNMVQVVHEQ